MFSGLTQIIVLLAASRSALSQSVWNDWCNPSIDSCGGAYPPGHDHIGPSWWAINAKSSEAIIMSLTASLFLPIPPSDRIGMIVINPALENTNISDTSDNVPKEEVFQTITAAAPPGSCGQSTSQWCTFSSAYSYSPQPRQYSGAAVPIDTYHAGDTIRLNYTYHSDYKGQKSISQTPMVQNPCVTEVIQPLSSPTKEAPWQIWLKTECQCGSKGTILAHRYENMTIVLDREVPDFGQHSVISSNSTSSIPHTEDGGKTWTIAEIVLNDNYCENIDRCEST